MTILVGEAILVNATTTHATGTRSILGTWFVNQLDLPRGDERELVRDRDREHSLRGSESRTLSLVGVFRVIPARDLQDHNGQPCDPREGDLRHLREQGLVRTIPLAGHRQGVVVLTERGKDLLESHRKQHAGSRDREGRGGGKDDDWRQRFYAELKKPREVEHDSQIYRAYKREADRLQERGACRAHRSGLRAEARVPAVPAGAESWARRQRRAPGS